MGFTAIKTSIKDGRIKLLFACLLFLVMVQNAAAERKINCRRYVHAPECRGIAAKRDTARFADDYRVPPEDVEELSKSSLNEKFLRRSLFGELLRKVAERNNLDYDPGTGNYLK